MVFSWHFVTINDLHLASASVIPLSLLTEGHTGVALFMTLSGYLFAKLIDGKTINYPSFLWNRALRLLPLLIVVVVIVGFRDYFNQGEYLAYFKRILLGFVTPDLPNGGWSITTEFHFYLILPALLYVSRRSTRPLLFLVLAAVLIRWLIFHYRGEIHSLSYWTIVGRFDQFVFGIAAYQYRDFFQKRHFLALSVFIAFSVFYWYFEHLGGFFLNPSYPSPSPVWIIMTTCEGLAYGILIAWYDNSFKHSTGPVSRFIALIGAYSYSIYLLHFFFYSALAGFVDRHVVSLSNVYVALLFAPVAFLVMIPISYLSYRFIEFPFLKFRTSYIKKE